MLNDKLMFYLPNETRFTKITKHAVFWLSIAVMFAIFIMLFNDDAKIPRREIVMKVDIRNKVNVCLPEEDDIFERSFFDF